MSTKLEPGPDIARPTVEALRDSVGRLFGAERRLRGRNPSHGEAGALTVGQVRSLAALAREREMTAGQLARSADLNPASVTAMLDHLEAAGIVERRRSQTDRRVCNVALTEAGWQILEEQLSAWQSLWEQSLAEIGDRELEIATRVTARVAAMLDSLNQPADLPGPG
jgi:DNA-binding MarR family transcriptional regulator